MMMVSFRQHVNSKKETFWHHLPSDVPSKSGESVNLSAIYEVIYIVQIVIRKVGRTVAARVNILNRGSAMTEKLNVSDFRTDFTLIEKASQGGVWEWNLTSKYSYSGSE